MKPNAINVYWKKRPAAMGKNAPGNHGGRAFCAIEPPAGAPVDAKVRNPENPKKSKPEVELMERRLKSGRSGAAHLASLSHASLSQ